ncbi:MAG: hypothetical protein AB7O91_06735 [Sphingomonas sp.]
MSATLVLATAAVLVTAILCMAGLSAWRGWLALRRLEIERCRDDIPAEDVGTRIELAAVKERLKKLEAIASGVEL